MLQNQFNYWPSNIWKTWDQINFEKRIKELSTYEFKHSITYWEISYDQIKTIAEKKFGMVTRSQEEKIKNYMSMIKDKKKKINKSLALTALRNMIN